jgi:TM2 domain-containing membrane protein YozV
MPQCKNCHREISKFDSDICPFCGTPHPIDDNYKTKDMTQFVDPVSGDYKLYKSKRKLVAGLLCALLGYFGAHDFYLGFWKKGLIEAGVSLVLVGGLGSLLYFLSPLTFWGYLIPALVLVLFYALFSLRYFKGESTKDSAGEFLR